MFGRVRHPGFGIMELTHGLGHIMCAHGSLIDIQIAQVIHHQSRCSNIRFGRGPDFAGKSVQHLNPFPKIGETDAVTLQHDIVFWVPSREVQF